MIETGRQGWDPAELHGLCGNEWEPKLPDIETTQIVLSQVVIGGIQRVQGGVAQ